MANFGSKKKKRKKKMAIAVLITKVFTAKLF